MRDDVAAMSHRSDSASNSFLEDNGKADADKAVCVSGSPTPPSPLYAPQKPKKKQKNSQPENMGPGQTTTCMSLPLCILSL